MSDYTYIVFGESGNFFSKNIKEQNSNIKIIHFLDKYYEDYSCADIKVYLDDTSLGHVGYSYSRYEDLEINDKLNKSIDNALENIQNVIIMDGIEDGFYTLMLLITKKALKKNIHCVNLFFEPFNCFGKRRKEIYKNFFKEITHIKKDNYYFSCECLRKYNLTKYGFFSIFNLINRIQYNISINLDKDINLTIENTISNEFDTTNESINKSLPKQYTYVSVIYDDDIVAKTINEPSFYYKTDLEDIWINDKVLVNRNGKDVIGIVIDIEKFYEEDVPFPIDKTKNIIKIIEKAVEIEKNSDSDFYIEPCDYCMLLIHDSKNDIEEKLKLTRGFIVDKDYSDIDELINKCDIITTIGDVDITKYNLSDKYIININNNSNNYGKYTTTTFLSNDQECIQVIKAIYYVLFYTGFITLGLYDIAMALEGKFRYKSFTMEENEKIYEEININKIKKIFIIFEVPYNSTVYEISDILEKLRKRNKKIDLNFGAPVVDIDEIKINVFYEI